MANEEQIRLWNEVNAQRWIRLRDSSVRPLIRYGEAALAALDPKPGEAALDVGCGFGDTTLALARKTGNALGIDICEPFLDIARKEAIPGARYLLADAQTHRFDERFDLCFSRFGVMFFQDPNAAFSNLHSAMRENGRFAAVAWSSFRENEWTVLPAEIVRRHLPMPDPSLEQGPFGLSEPGKFERILKTAGFGGIAVREIAGTFETSAAQLMEQGPAAAYLRSVEASPELRAEIERDLREAMPARPLGATVLLASAKA
jgi:ubiquinone/menaquinone biosynthesis C-methylase UbiE